MNSLLIVSIPSIHGLPVNTQPPLTGTSLVSIFRSIFGHDFTSEYYHKYCDNYCSYKLFRMFINSKKLQLDEWVFSSVSGNALDVSTSHLLNCLLLTLRDHRQARGKMLIPHRRRFWCVQLFVCVHNYVLF